MLTRRYALDASVGVLSGKAADGLADIRLNMGLAMTILTLTDVDEFELADLRQALVKAGVDPDAVLSATPMEPLDGDRAGSLELMLVSLVTQVDPNLVISVLSLWLLRQRSKSRSTETIIETLPDGTTRTRTVTLAASSAEAPASSLIAVIKGWLTGPAPGANP